MEFLGMKLRDPLPENAIPVDAVVVIKFLDDDGDGFHLTTTESLSDVEAFGLLSISAAVQKDNIINNMEDHDDNDEDKED